ncbi:MAG: serine protease [Crocinitomicaceae bacterium]|nr:serine protease [Crocinitomicaceae bacterium]|tara:strand:+ start:48987 stop:51191 length:2205 start_codon:yes stop_codon:yes gene_type:complete
MFADVLKIRRIMLRKGILLCATIALMFQPNAKADEGMWLPMLVKRLNYVDMQKAGLKLTPEEIYSVNNASLKDAIVGLGSPARNFCSGEIVSKQGLFITNHHCGFGVIQDNSTTEHNYLKDGFWAMTKEEEIPAGFSISILHHMDDVTPMILEAMNDTMNEIQRAQAARPIMDSLSKANSEEGRFKAVIKSFFAGNEYYMFVYEVFPDVRLVGAPPSSIGKFGGDTDNWMWPRHTGDFTMFRIYSNAENKPAQYSAENVPYTPKHHLPVNIKGTKKDDFSMIFGFPGGTDRYMSSFGVDHKVNVDYPDRIKLRRTKLDLYEEGMNSSEAIQIQYASKHAGVSNYWKNFIGMTKALNSLGVADKKRSEEADFEKWSTANSDRKAKYGEVLSLYKNGFEAMKSSQTKYNFFVEGFASQGVEMSALARNYGKFAAMLEKDDTDPKVIDEMTQKLKDQNAKHFKNYNKAVDINVMAAIFEMYAEAIPEADRPEYFQTLIKKSKGDYMKLAKWVAKKSMFDDEDKMEAFLNKANAKSILKDPAFKISKAVWDDFYNTVVPARQQASMDIAKAERLYIDAIRQMNPNKSYYPDANSTLRLTYGNILPYEARDAVFYEYYTTAEGILEKYTPGDLEFDAPSKLIKMIKDKDFGRYGKDGELRVCFLSNNDITGGNSGSGVVNAEGHLIGTAFDGNWEAMSGDVAFEQNLQRTISVDIRYTLFIIDKFAGAGHLVKEMTVIE